MPTHLSVRRPSLTTVFFSVSNTPSRSSIAAKPILYLEVILRILGFAVILLVIAAKTRHHLNALDGIVTWDNIWASTIGAIACHIADSYNSLLIASSSSLGVYLVFRRGYSEESLLVVRGLGVQTSTSSATYLSTPATRFIPTTQIQDIVIHEAFKGFEVRFYLAIMVEGESEVIVVFPNLLPQRLILEEVWRGARRCLYEPKS